MLVMLLYTLTVSLLYATLTITILYTLTITILYTLTITILYTLTIMLLDKVNYTLYHRRVNFIYTSPCNLTDPENWSVFKMTTGKHSVDFGACRNTRFLVIYK